MYCWVISQPTSSVYSVWFHSLPHQCTTEWFHSLPHQCTTEWFHSLPHQCTLCDFTAYLISVLCVISQPTSSVYSVQFHSYLINVLLFAWFHSLPHQCTTLWVISQPTSLVYSVWFHSLPHRCTFGATSQPASGEQLWQRRAGRCSPCPAWTHACRWNRTEWYRCDPAGNASVMPSRTSRMASRAVWMPQHAHHYILNMTMRLHELNMIMCLHNLNGTEHAQQNTKRPKIICCLKHITVGECVNSNLNQNLNVFNDRGNKTCLLFTKLFTAVRVGKASTIGALGQLFTDPFPPPPPPPPPHP